MLDFYDLDFLVSLNSLKITILFFSLFMVVCDFLKEK